MEIITQTEGFYIIGAAAVSLTGGVVSYRSDTVVRRFDTEAEMLEIHRDEYPDQYVLDQA